MEIYAPLAGRLGMQRIKSELEDLAFRFLDPESFKTLSGKLAKTQKERDHYIEVVELVPGGAAWRQGGLAPNDLILAVQQEGKDVVDVVDMRLDDVVKMIRGPKKTIVRRRRKVTEEMVRERAYFNSMNESGSPVDHWLAAERELLIGA